jgi:hypothetical protein
VTASRLAPLLCATLAGCGGAPRAIDQLAAEVHLHQFPPNSHAWAAFVSRPVALADVASDSLYQIEPQPTARDGACALYEVPTCTPDCDASSFCAATNQCKPFDKPTYIDGGELDVTGSRLHDTIRMWYAPGSATYLADPAPGRVLLFDGGELLHLAGGAGISPASA